MNRKGSMTTLEAVVALVITALIVIALLRVIDLIWPQAGEDETSLNIFYYQKFIEDIKAMSSNETKVLGILSNSDFALIGFSKNTNEINSNDLKDSCGKVDITGKITKPMSCQGNSCLCFCKVDTNVAGLGGGIVIKCEDEETKCEQFKENVIGDLSCNYFLYYKYNEEFKEFNVTKTLDNILIK